jgi:hypothetical protein
MGASLSVFTRLGVDDLPAFVAACERHFKLAKK